MLFVGPYFVVAQLTTNNGTIPQKLGVKITSPKANQTVPLGQLTIYGTSSDTPESNCQVFADWNDAKPMQNVTGIGPGGLNDYSNWTFTYTQKYHLITEGTNELTSKISCTGNYGINNITSKYYSINITGSANPTSFSTTTTSQQFGSDNSTTSTNSIGYHSILPQYYTAFTNDSHKPSSGNVSKIEMPNSNMYIEIHSGYSDDDKAAGDKKDKGKIEFHTMSSMISSKVEKIKNGQNDLNIKWYNGNLNNQDLNKYIHNLIKEKLNRISERLN